MRVFFAVERGADDGPRHDGRYMTSRFAISPSSSRTEAKGMKLETAYREVRRSD